MPSPGQGWYKESGSQVFFSVMESVRGSPVPNSSLLAGGREGEVLLPPLLEHPKLKPEDAGFHRCWLMGRSAAVDAGVSSFRSSETWKNSLCASAPSRWDRMGKFQQQRQAVRVAEGRRCGAQTCAAAFSNPRDIKAGDCSVGTSEMLPPPLPQT